MCARNASVLIDNSTFVANTAIGDAGALQAEASNVTISNSISATIWRNVMEVPYLLWITPATTQSRIVYLLITKLVMMGELCLLGERTAI